VSPKDSVNTTPHSDWSLEVTGFTGYSDAKLNWSIGGGLERVPNYLSELTWRDLKIWQEGLSAEVTFKDRWVLKLSGAYGSMFDGTSQDSDYDGFNRTRESTRSYADTRGYTVDASALLGVRFHLFQERLVLTPSLGYSYQRQQVNDTNGITVLDVGFHDLGPFGGLNDFYTTRWNAGVLDLDGRWNLNSRWTVLFGSRLGLGAYEGTAVWNLRSDFQQNPSFRHTTNSAIEFGARLGAEYEFAAQWSLRFMVSYEKNWSRNGLEQNYLTGGEVFPQAFNGAQWRSVDYLVAIRHQF
jgi:hypothetical protein